jgi:hypothetical protein
VTFSVPEDKGNIERNFDDIDDIRSNMMVVLKACLEGWTRHWHRCIASQGEYYESDHSDIQQ